MSHQNDGFGALMDDSTHMQDSPNSQCRQLGIDKLLELDCACDRLVEHELCNQGSKREQRLPHHMDRRLKLGEQLLEKPWSFSAWQ